MLVLVSFRQHFKHCIAYCIVHIQWKLNHKAVQTDGESIFHYLDHCAMVAPYCYTHTLVLPIHQHEPLIQNYFHYMFVVKKLFSECFEPLTLLVG